MPVEKGAIMRHRRGFPPLAGPVSWLDPTPVSGFAAVAGNRAGTGTDAPARPGAAAAARRHRGRRQSRNPIRVASVGEEPAEERRQVVRRWRHGQQLQRDAVRELLEERRSTRQTRITKQADAIHFVQRGAQQLRHRGATFRMPFEHAEEEPQPRGRRRAAFGGFIVGRGLARPAGAQPAAEVFQPLDRVGERRVATRSRHQPIDAHRGRSLVRRHAAGLP